METPVAFFCLFFALFLRPINWKTVNVVETMKVEKMRALLMWCSPLEHGSSLKCTVPHNRSCVSGGGSVLLTGAFPGYVVVVLLCLPWWLCSAFCRGNSACFHSAMPLRHQEETVMAQHDGKLAVEVSLDGGQLPASMGKHDSPEHYPPEKICMACRRPRWCEPNQGVTLSRHWQGLVNLSRFKYVVCGLFWLCKSEKYFLNWQSN